MPRKRLLHKLENSRNKLHELVAEKSSFLDPEVIKASQDLDQLILAYQRINR